MLSSILQWMSKSRSTGKKADVDFPSTATWLRPQSGLNPKKAEAAKVAETQFGPRKSMEQLAQHLATQRVLVPVFKSGGVVTTENIASVSVVVRGPNWMWRDEDGGEGKPGHVCNFDLNKGTCTVIWLETSTGQNHYRFRAGCHDLCIPVGEVDLGEAGSTFAPTYSNFGTAFSARDSQATFTDKSQTAIIFDWDDTLFPTTYIRHDLGLDLHKPLKDQNLPLSLKQEVAANLQKCATNAANLLRLACTMGKVILVTLASPPWVTDACKLFYPSIGSLLTTLGITAIYAQEDNPVDHDALQGKSYNELEIFWSKVKGKAIGKALKVFYSQYKGQSWKNILSIGDSNFERLGTISATEEYMQELGVHPEEGQDQSAASNRPLTCQANIRGHKYRLRTKTLKLVDQPTIEELTMEIDICRQWLPHMVCLDAGFDVDLSALDNVKQLQNIEEMLCGSQEFRASDTKRVVSF